MKTREIEGQVVWLDFEGGFWGIEDKQGRKWKPDEMPATLQKKGQSVKATVRQSTQQFSVSMWGTAIEIVRFETV